nr:uncharacterized protein LOC113820696 [Penaeus vannamei]
MENKNTSAEQKLEAPKCKEDSLLPIAEKGLFFHDSFFEDIRKHFETAIDQILDTWGETKSVSDLMSSYRRVRDRNLQQENHVMAFSEDDHNHKVVLDVHDFKSGDVKVRVEDNQVVVEGRVEKEEDNRNHQLSQRLHSRWFFETLEENTFTKYKDDSLFATVVTSAA